MLTRDGTAIRFKKTYNDVFRSAAQKHFGSSHFQDKIAELTPEQQDKHHAEMDRFMTADLLGELRKAVGDDHDLVHEVASRIVFGHGDGEPAFFKNYKPKDCNLVKRFVSFGRGYASSLTSNRSRVVPPVEKEGPDKPKAKPTRLQTIVKANRDGEAERLARVPVGAHGTESFNPGNPTPEMIERRKADPLWQYHRGLISRFGGPANSRYAPNEKPDPFHAIHANQYHTQESNATSDPPEGMGPFPPFLDRTLIRQGEPRHMITSDPRKKGAAEILQGTDLNPDVTNRAIAHPRSHVFDPFGSRGPTDPAIYPLHQLAHYAVKGDPYRVWSASILGGNRHAIPHLVDWLRSRDNPAGWWRGWSNLYKRMEREHGDLAPHQVADKIGKIVDALKADPEQARHLTSTFLDMAEAGKRAAKGTTAWTARRGTGDPASGPIWEVRDHNGRWILGVPQSTSPTQEEAIDRASSSERGPSGLSRNFTPYYLMTDAMRDANFPQHWSDLVENYLGNVMPELRSQPRGRQRLNRGEPIRLDKELLVHTRVPSAPNLTEEFYKNPYINLESIRSVPESFNKNLATFAKTPNFRDGVRRTREDFLKHVIGHMTRNLLFLYDATPDKVRNGSKLWYDGAHRLTKALAKKYKFPHVGVAGITAALSPKLEWFQNYDLARRLIHIASTQKDYRWDAPMSLELNRTLGDSKSSKDSIAAIKKIAGGIVNKKLSDLKDPVDQAIWVRLFDQAHLPRHYRIINPDGALGEYEKSDITGEESTAAWQSTAAIAKAMKIFNNPNRDAINQFLGSYHKIRNFHNNIIDPNSLTPFVTVDTHAVNANMLFPMSQEHEIVERNFDTKSGASGSKISGAIGTYGINMEPYIRAAAERGVKPREMQSITWEAIRGLFTRAQKSKMKGEKTNHFQDKISDIWKDHASGKISEDEARDRIVKTSGGFEYPRWFSTSGGYAGFDPEEKRNSRQPRESVGADVSRGSSRSDPSGGQGGTSRDSSKREIVLADRGDGLIRLAIKAGDTESGFAVALQRMHTANHNAYVTILRRVFDQIGIKPAKIIPVLHDDQESTRPSIAAAIVRKIDQNAAMYAAAWHGILTRQPSILAFHSHPEGPDSIYQLHLQGGGEDVRNSLNSAGIGQRVMIPHENGFRVLISDKGRQQRQAVGQFAAANGTQVGEATGTAYEIGGADDKEGRAAYRGVIDKIEQTPAQPSPKQEPNNAQVG